jgi:hypothetical protein
MIKPPPIGEREENELMIHEKNGRGKHMCYIKQKTGTCNGCKWYYSNKCPRSKNDR